jgi:hypothetical protein
MHFTCKSTIVHTQPEHEVVGVSNFKAELLRRVLQSAVQKFRDARRHTLTAEKQIPLSSPLQKGERGGFFLP